MNIESARADERLIHGQLINEWLHVLKPTRLLVCDDALMQMPFMANMYRSLVPIWLEARILSLEQTVEYLRLHADTEGRIFLLFRTPESALHAWERGIRFSLLTLADKQYFPNKLEVPEPQKAAIRLLHAAGVTVAAQETPLSEMRLLETFEK